MRENRTSGSEGGEAQTNELSLPLSLPRVDQLTRAAVRRCAVTIVPASVVSLVGFGALAA